MALRASVLSGIVLLLPFFTLAAACPNLTRHLSLGSRGQDVVQLQNFLIAQGDLAAGNNTGYYGKLTEAAVKKFQARKGIVSSGTSSSTGYGAVGKKTRAKIAEVCGASAKTSALNASSQKPYVPTQPPELAQCPLVELPIGKSCSGTWKEVKDAKGCTASWSCQ